jgi:chromosome segregation ATPase
MCVLAGASCYVVAIHVNYGGVQAANAAAAAAAAAQSADTELHALQANNSQLQHELRSRTAAMEGLVAARDEAARGLAEAKRQLESEQAAAAAAKAAASALERRLGDITAKVGQ